MTEEILQAAILRLKSRVTEQFAIIKDIYHRPATLGTVDEIVKHAALLAQLEGAMVTLQQYGPLLAKQTNAEAESNKPEEPPTEEEPKPITTSDLKERSPTYRKAKKTRKRKTDEP